MQDIESRPHSQVNRQHVLISRRHEIEATYTKLEIFLAMFLQKPQYLFRARERAHGAGAPPLGVLQQRIHHLLPYAPALSDEHLGVYHTWAGDDARRTQAWL